MDPLKDQRIINSIVSNMKKSRSMNSAERSLNASTSRLLDQHLEFVPASSSSFQHNSLKNKYKPINTTSPHNKQESNEINKTKAIIEICPSEKIDLCWPPSCNKVASGMKNLGNTCFLNSTLQCLLHTPPLYNYLLSKQHRCQLNTFCMACALKNLIGIAFSSNDQTSPTLILQNLRFIAKHMKWGRQEDAHEFLRYVIDALHQTDLIGHEKLDASSKETTMPYQIFAGYLKSIVLCSKCNNKSEKLDPFLDICLDIQNVQDVIAGLKKFVSPDMLGGENMYHCLHCKSKTNAQKYFKFHKLPNVFTIQLKRYLMNGNKISRHVSFPEVLNLSAFMLPEKDSNTSNINASNTYKLYSVLVHEGSSRNSGHYYCYVRGPNNVWYCMNDSSVSQTSLQNILRAQAYILFYLRECNANRGQKDSTYNKSLLNTTPSQLNSTFPTQNNSGVKNASSNSLNKFVSNKYVQYSTSIQPQNNHISFNSKNTPSLNSSKVIYNSGASLYSINDSKNLTKANLFQNKKNVHCNNEMTLSNKENIIKNINKQNVNKIGNITGEIELEALKRNVGSEFKSCNNVKLIKNDDIVKSENVQICPAIKNEFKSNMSQNDAQIFEIIKNDNENGKLLSPKSHKITSFSNQNFDEDKLNKFDMKIENETNIDVLKYLNLAKFKNSKLELDESLKLDKEEFKIKDIKSQTKTATKFPIDNCLVNGAFSLNKNIKKSVKKINTESNDRLQNDLNNIYQDSLYQLKTFDESKNKSTFSDNIEILSKKKRKSNNDNNKESILEQRKKKLKITNGENKQILLFEKIHNQLSRISFDESKKEDKNVSHMDNKLEDYKHILKRKLKKAKFNNNENILKNSSSIKNNNLNGIQSSDNIKLQKTDKNDKAHLLKNSLCVNKKLQKKLNENLFNVKIKGKNHKQKVKPKKKKVPTATLR